MQILRYENRKMDPIFYDISTPEKREAGYRCLFKILNEEWMVYEDLKEVTDRSKQSHSQRRQRILYCRAEVGDYESIKLLMNCRKNYEYEKFFEEDVVDPLVPQDNE